MNYGKEFTKGLIRENHLGFSARNVSDFGSYHRSI